MAAYFVYITASDKQQALEVAQTLVEERLAACANILENMTSVYQWQGKIEHGRETVLIAKTRQEFVEPLVERVKALHSYDCPCVVAWPLEKGNPDFLEWIEAETGGG